MSTALLSIFFVVIGQFLNASIVLIDKYIVTKTTVSKPAVYAFYVGIISGVVIVLLPLGIIEFPSATVLGLSVLLGLIFILSIILLFTALKAANATDVVAWLTAFSTISTFLLSGLLLNESLPGSFPFALVFFIIGAVMVGHFRFNRKSFLLVIISGILFGLSAVLIKILFQHTTFWNGFFWSRMGNVFGALILLSFSQIRLGLVNTSKSVGHKASFLIILNRVLGGVAFLSILYAIRLGSVSIANALGSLQFVFVFLMVFLLRHKIPDLFHHEFRPGHIAHKIVSIVFIITGFFVLFL
ncbi:MAG: hypothetical protein COV95_01840 [Candidatus Zambryskibacteria bacterium CG11_big_fil_rev_8_21_14_0_20_40_24]|uniref:EamA domain-containing protein n=1 Tax=Candidatus Zambryskibacteria bacterium CG11_big_fil_rev_8_21_14_0_20_40_24 TaxID=1975116 RepID=A0A2H0K6K2_9BACT|nr:MAG: hypothetical protein COV95_01840 [Candidatus Zambryskibacteria bacterium CG11_big_fil_rev_8_21_14_0_20_40_24]